MGCLRPGAPEPLLGNTSAATVDGLSLFLRGYIAGKQALAERLGVFDAPDQAGFAERLMAAAYRTWGAELPLHVDGEYALAVYDWKYRTLALMHDELGLTHLYYSQAEDQLWFGTGLPDLVDRIADHELDEDYIADFLANREHFGELTPYRRIRRLMAGESLLWEGRARLVTFWSFTDVPTVCFDRDAEFEERFCELVDQAVRTALPKEGATLCELSGGLDSSTIYCVASAVGPVPDAMSWTFPISSHADERAAIQAVLAGRRGQWFPLDADATPPFSVFPTRWYAEPSPWLLVEGWDRLYRDLLAARGTDVVLSGEGGDAVLLGDQHEPLFFADLLLRGRWRRLVQEARHWRRTTNTRRSSSYLLLSNAAVPAWRFLVGRTLEFRTVPVPWLRREYAESYQLARRGAHSRGWPADNVQSAQALQRVRRSAQIIANYNRHRGDVAEFRHPLLYRPLLRFMLGVPAAKKMSPSRDRDLQRRALRDVLPAFTLARSDKGGGDQPYYSGLEQGTAWLERLADGSHVAERGYVDAVAWTRALRQAGLGRCVALKCLQATAAVEIWLQQLEERRASPLPPLASLPTAA